MGFQCPFASGARDRIAAKVRKLGSGTLGHIRISAKACKSSEYVNGNGVFQCEHGGSPVRVLDREEATLAIRNLTGSGAKRILNRAAKKGI
jgi:hypothetical protein